MVILQAQNQNASDAPRARTDESGRFNFSGLPAGRHSVSALAPGYVSLEDSNFPGMRGKTFNLTDGDRVEGTNDPKVHAKLSQISLSATVRSTSPGSRALTRGGSSSVNADGSFRLSGLHPGKVMIVMTKIRELAMSRIERDGAPASDGIEVAVGEQV